jgi:hypothetical protein
MLVYDREPGLIAKLLLSAMLLASLPASAETVQLEQLHGIFMVPVQINDVVTVPFILDTGASEVVIPADVFLVLQRSRTISKADFKGTGSYSLADGSNVSSDRYVLHKMVVGDHVMTDVIASVAPIKGDPLLGQTFLSKLPAWKIDNARHVLVLNEDGEVPDGRSPPLRAAGLTGWMWGWWPWSYTGVYTWANGDRYDGEWRYSMPSGHGVRTKTNGDRYQGEWREGKRTGYGVFTGTNGDRYEGGFLDGDAHGRGSKTWANGDRYEGEWRNDKRHGRGIYTYANGDRYDGEWRDGKPNGRGGKTFASGNGYDGEWRDGKPTGQGVSRWANGDRYDGEWRDGKQNGRGVLAFASGNRYDGEFHDGKQNGRGVFTWANGNRYDGEWRDGKPNGRGVATSVSGAVYNGIWINGCFRDGDQRTAFNRDLASCP